MQRRLLAALLATTVLLIALAPTTSAECMTWPLEARVPPRIAFAFVASVADVEQHDDPAYEVGSGLVRYRIKLDIERIYRGRVPQNFQLTGTNYGCSFLYASALAEGERLFIASERLGPDPFETQLGNAIVWRQVGSDWVFYEAALNSGSDRQYYSAAARKASTTAAIVRLVLEAPLPDTDTASERTDRLQGVTGSIVFLFSAFACAFGAVYRRRRPA